MSRDKYKVIDDIYCDPNGVLINELGITDPEVLEEAETELSLLNLEAITFSEPPYDLDYLRRLHRELFSDIYDWAGELRRVDIKKGNSRFCNCQYLEKEAQKIFKSLEERNYLANLSKEELAIGTAEFYGEINALHPFRDGNGRAQRLLFEHIIIHAGYQISFSTVGKDEWVDANIHSFFGDQEPLELIFERCISDPNS